MLLWGLNLRHLPQSLHIHRLQILSLKLPKLTDVLCLIFGRHLVLRHVRDDGYLTPNLCQLPVDLVYRLAEGVRQAVSAWGLKLCARDAKGHSDTVSAILLPEGYDSAALVRHAYTRYNLSLGMGLNKVAGKVFRIGHLGDLNEIMCLTAVAGSEMAMRDMGVPVEAGSGVAAAMEYYRTQGAAAALKNAA